MCTLKHRFKAARALISPSSRFIELAVRVFYTSMPDEEYLKRMYKAVMYRELDFQNPQTFTKKLNWLKLCSRKPEYAIMADKYAVKEFVSDIMGEENVIPLIGVWDNHDDIDFNVLPDHYERVKFVSKILRLSQKDFSKMIGLTQTSLSMIEVVTNVLTEKNIKLICATFNVREEWLREGKGKIFNDSPCVKEICDILRDLTPETQKSLLVLAKELLRVEQKQCKSEEKSSKSEETEKIPSPIDDEVKQSKDSELQKICEEIQKAAYSV